MSDVLKIQVKALRWFVEAQCGGVQQVEGLTTAEVVDTFLRPFVRRQEKCPPDGTSFAFLVWSEGLSSYGQSGPFISHAWGQRFDSLIEALERGVGGEVYVWIDFLCYNMVSDTFVDGHFFASTFYSTVRECELVVMICDACAEAQETANTVHRLWCLFEVWAAVQTKAKFQIVLTESAKHSIQKDQHHWSRTLLSKPIGLDQAKCTDKADQRVIMLQIGEQAEAFNAWVEVKIRTEFHRGLEALGVPVTDWNSTMESMQTRRASQIVPPVSILEKDLQKACKSGNVNEVKDLLSRGANLAGKDSDNNTSLHIAAYNGHTNVIMLLLEKGADATNKNHQGNTALHAAAFSGHATPAQKLVEKNSDIAARNDQGATPLHVASQRGHYSVAGMLLACGAPVNVQDDWGATALDLAKASEGSKNTKQVQELLRTHGGQAGARGCKCIIA